jgi:hypothetical protein
MKSLSEYIKESIFDIDEEPQNQLEKDIKEEIKQFLKDNYRGASKCKISIKPNEDGKYVVDCKGALSVKNTKATSLTNGNFVFGEVDDTFYCAYRALTSLEGAPQKVGGDFNCSYCNSLTSLEGAPKEVRGKFSCSSCKRLATLKGAPESVGENFECHFCKKLTSLEGAPKEVRGEFDCSWCDSLTSLKGAPKWVGGDFNCGGGEQKFDEKEVRKHIPHMGGKAYV